MPKHVARFLPDRTPRVEFSESGDSVTLLHDVLYSDPRGRIWRAPKGAVVDGASIPRWARVAIGPPMRGRYMLASIMHDVYCDMGPSGQTSSAEVHRMFYDAMRTSGVPAFKAWIMWMGVRIGGPRWRKP